MPHTETIQLQQVPGAALWIDLQGTIVAVNQELAELLGHAAGDLCGRPLRDLLGPSAMLPAEEELTPFWRRQERSISRQVRLQRQDGSLFHALLNGRGRQAGGALVGVTDISPWHKPELETRLQQGSFYHQSTGLPTQPLIRDRLEQTIHRADHHRQQGGVLLLGFDSASNQQPLTPALNKRSSEIELSRRLECLLPINASVGHYGTGQFAVLIDQISSLRSLCRWSYQLLESLGDPLQNQPHQPAPCPHLGIALFPDDSHSSTQLLQLAEEALLRAETDPHPSLRFASPERESQAFQELQLERELRQALQEGQFRLHYQPLADLPAGEVRAVEALLRWQHPNRGMLPPAEFLRDLELSSQVRPVSHWILTEACSQVQQWRQVHKDDLQLTVNMFSSEFTRHDFPGLVAKALQESGLPAAELTLEINETTLMADPAASVLALKALRDIGVRVAVDDFGSSYSSLPRLQDFSLQTLKMNRSLVGKLPHDRHHKAVAEAIMNLAADLKLQVVAAGVETTAQHDYLRRQNCPQMQGYYYARPMPAEDFSVWMEGQAGGSENN